MLKAITGAQSTGKRKDLPPVGGSSAGSLVAAAEASDVHAHQRDTACEETAALVKDRLEEQEADGTRNQAVEATIWRRASHCSSFPLPSLRFRWLPATGDGQNPCFWKRACCGGSAENTGQRGGPRMRLISHWLAVTKRNIPLFLDDLAPWMRTVGNLGRDALTSEVRSLS